MKTMQTGPTTPSTPGPNGQTGSALPVEEYWARVQALRADLSRLRDRGQRSANR